MMKFNEISINTCEMHCAGEPVRIVERGFPKLHPEVADDVQGYISYLKQNLDQWRRFLMHEPRGHQEMYGVLLLQSSGRDEAQPVVFMHHTGYSPMCGHASLALARYFAEKRTHCDEDGEAAVLLKVACGLVKTWYINKGPEKGWSKFWSVPAFVEKTKFPSNVLYVSRLNPTVFNINAILYCCFYVYYELNNHSVSNIPLKLNNGKAITVDVAFGGGYYAVLPAEMVDFQFGVHSIKQLAGLGREIEAAVKDSLEWQGKSSVIIEIKGQAFYSGQSTFVLEDEDPLGFGFDVE
uniref:trans-L-3-hydroxyproline dehydratase n=1 Tax=Romanomermis culicivorax TaxID=13658 RepID=A0A915K0C0_ROMCU